MVKPSSTGRTRNPTKFWLGAVLIVHLALIATLRADSIELLTLPTLGVLLAIYLYREATVDSPSTRGDKWLGALAMLGCFALAGLALTRTSTWPMAAAIGFSLLAVKLWLTGGLSKTLVPLAVFLALLIRLPPARQEFLIASYNDFISTQSRAVLDWWHVPSLVLSESVQTIHGEWLIHQGWLFTPGFLLLHGTLGYLAIAARSKLWSLLLLVGAVFWTAFADIARIVVSVALATAGWGQTATVSEIATVLLTLLALVLLYFSDRLIQVIFAPMPVHRRHKPQPFVRFWNERLAFGTAKVRTRTR